MVMKTKRTCCCAYPIPAEQAPGITREEFPIGTSFDCKTPDSTLPPSLRAASDVPNDRPEGESRRGGGTAVVLRTNF